MQPGTATLGSSSSSKSKQHTHLSSSTGAYVACIKAAVVAAVGCRAVTSCNAIGRACATILAVTRGGAGASSGKGGPQTSATWHALRR